MQRFKYIKYMLCTYSIIPYLIHNQYKPALFLKASEKLVYQAVQAIAIL